VAGSNVDMVREVFERWNGGDFEVREQDTDPEIEVITQTSRFQGEPYRGIEGVRRWIAETLEYFEEWELRLDEVQAVGDRVLGVGRMHLKGRGSGVDIDAPCAWIFDFREGRCTRFETFLNRVDEARELASTKRMPRPD
jgi:ketosteroid isomerase-like protein